MISAVSARIVKWLLRAGAISQNDKELYEYAAYSFLFSLLPLCLVIVLGSIIGMLVEGILMMLPFMMIRKFSGGVHLKSSTICFVSSTLLLSIFILVIKTITTESKIIIFTCFTIASAIQIFLCSPLDNEARKLSEREFSVFRKVARTMSAIFLSLYLLLLLFEQVRFATPIGAGIILTALLQVPCIFTRRYRPI